MEDVGEEGKKKRVEGGGVEHGGHGWRCGDRMREKGGTGDHLTLRLPECEWVNYDHFSPSFFINHHWRRGDLKGGWRKRERGGKGEGRRGETGNRRTIK